MTPACELAARLKSGQKIDEPLEALRKAAKSYDNALSGLANGGMITDSDRQRHRRCRRSPPMKPRRCSPTAASCGTRYKAKLDPVLRFSGSPYARSRCRRAAAEDASLRSRSRVQLSPRGRRLQAALQRSQSVRRDLARAAARVMGDLTTQVESRSRSAVRHAARHAGRSAWSPPAAARRDLLLLRAQPAQGRSRLEPRSARRPRTFCAR